MIHRLDTARAAAPDPDTGLRHPGRRGTQPAGAPRQYADIGSRPPLRPDARRQAAPQRSTRIKRAGEPYAFAAPGTIVIAALMVVPVLIVIGYSLFDNVITEPDPSFVGLKNFIQLFATGDFPRAMANTAIFTATSVVCHMIIGVAFATMLNSKLLPGWVTAIFRVVFILPWLFTAAVVAVLWRLMLDPHGVINYLLEQLHLISSAVPWFSTPSTAMVSIVVMNIWAGYPFFMISLLAGLQGIPTSLVEAARVDGASGIHTFFNVVIPQLRPILISMSMLDILWTSQQFALIWLTTGGGPLNVTEMISTFTYKAAFSDYEFSQASAAAVVLIGFSLIIAIVYVRSQRRAEA
jgi:multiple sugar transport system permease protein